MGSIILNAKQCKGINHSYWDKRTRTHLPLTKVVVAQNVFIFILFQLLGQRSIYSHQSSAQAYKANKQAYTKNKAPTKRKDLKERTKGYARLDGSQKNTKGAWKGKAWLALKRWLLNVEQGPGRSH
jgi:hypothetical protein